MSTEDITQKLIEAIQHKEINKSSPMEIIAKAMGIIGPNTLDKELLVNVLKQIVEKDVLSEDTIHELQHMNNIDGVVQNIMDISKGNWDRILKF